MQDIDKLGGIVEVDETFVGGLAKNRHWDKRGGGGGTGGSVPAKRHCRRCQPQRQCRGSRDRERRMPPPSTPSSAKPSRTKSACFAPINGPATSRSTKIIPHATIDHARGQYVIGAIHTQTIEGFWSIFKRGVVGTFHKISRKYMPLYVAEFQFRYNNRENADIFGTAIKGC